MKNENDAHVHKKRIQRSHLMKECTEKAFSKKVAILSISAIVLVWSVYFCIPEGKNPPKEEMGAAKNNVAKINNAFPRYKKITIKQVSKKKKSGDKPEADHPGCFNRQETGILVDIDGLNRSRALEVSIERNDLYTIVFLKDGKILDGVKIPESFETGDGLLVQKVNVHRRVFKEGFDSVAIQGRGGDGTYCLGHIALEVK